MDVSFAVIYFTFSIFICFTIKNLMETFFAKRKSSVLILWLSILLYNVSTGFTFFIWNIPLINMSLGLMALFVVSLNYEAVLIKRFLAATNTFFLMVIVESFVWVIYVQSGLPLMQNVEFVRTPTANAILLVMGAVAYIFSLLLRKFLKNIKNDTLNSPMYLVSFLIITLVLYITVFLLFAHPNLHPLIITSVMSAIFVINVLSIFFLDRLSLAFEKALTSALHAQEKEYYFTQIQLMQASHEHIRAIRHDMKTHLGTVRGYSMENKANEITDYISSLLDDVSKDEVYCDTGNIAFDSIINFKLKNAKEKNLKPKLQMSIPRTLNIEVSDIVTILGNLIDNALDAVDKTLDKILSIDIEYSRGCLFIKVDNSFNGEVKYETKKTAMKNILSHKEPSEHGHGLKNIRKAVEKYNGKVDIQHEGNVFSVAILIYVDNNLSK